MDIDTFEEIFRWAKNAMIITTILTWMGIAPLAMTGRLHIPLLATAGMIIIVTITMIAGLSIVEGIQISGATKLATALTG